MLVSHAGHGSVMKALWHGRPMVLVPWGRDQPGVAARAEALGIAVLVPPEEASEGRLGAAVYGILADDAIRRRAEEHGSRLRATDPQATAVEALERLGGS